MLSIIIPVLNEEKALPATLEHLLPQIDNDEVIIVDGGSTDKTLHICKGHQQLNTIRGKTGRASQLNAGANIARGDTLVFLHADTHLPAGALQTIKNTLSKDNHQAGGFRHSFGSTDWRLRLISFLDNRRCLQTKIIYGDQAMFIRRGLFEQLEGYPDSKQLEDVYFCEKLVKYTKPVILDLYVETDPRKFIKMGIWRSLYRVAVIQSKHELGIPVADNYPFFADIR
jgi:rSAM/selenodomain-associated transferase 2